MEAPNKNPANWAGPQQSYARVSSFVGSWIPPPYRTLTSLVRKFCQPLKLLPLILVSDDPYR